MAIKLRTLVAVALTALILTGAGYYFIPSYLNKGSSSHFVPEKTGSMIRANDAAATPEATESLANASNQFGFEFYDCLNDGAGGNIFFSPYSIAAAYAMLYEGAKGQTADEIRAVFHFPQNDTARRANFAYLYNRLNLDNQGYTLNTADAAWVQEDYPILKEYLDIVKDYYMGNATNLDFKKATEAARQTINKWVEDHTGGRIKELVKPDEIDSYTAFVLTNAIYFKGDWQIQFDSAKTAQKDFHLASGATVKVPMMAMDSKDAKFNFLDRTNQGYQEDQLKLLELPYKGENVSMFFLLPKDNDLSALERSLTPEKLSNWQNAMEKEGGLDIQLPKFKMDCRYDLKKILKEMGMPSAFSSTDADFSGIDGNHNNIYISSSAHQANIEVNEKGTEAAAATHVTGTYAGISPSFVADHPFIFLIQDKATGTILFMGRVSDPTKGM